MFRALNLISLTVAFVGLSLSQVPPPHPLSAPATSAQTPDAAKPEAKPLPEVVNPPAESPKKDSAEGKADDDAHASRPAEAVTGKTVPVDKNLYTVGPEDSLYVRVWHEPDLSGTVDVRPDGYISMQLIGEMKADGMSLAQLSAAITKRLQDFIKNPEVNVQLLRVGSKKYSIHGEVNRPGTFPLTSPVTIMEALVNAAGFRDFANTKKIYLLRGSQRFNFNYKDVSKGKKLEQNIQVQNGDQIFVP
jgi:polysaccharide export outer membrane protein